MIGDHDLHWHASTCIPIQGASRPAVSERILGVPGANDDEFSELRKRAYGPDADIHDDPGALGRLRDLEGGERRDEIPPQPDVHSNLIVEQDGPSSLVEDEPHVGSGERIQVWLARAYRIVRQVRRSSVLIGVGVAVVTMSLLTAMILVQRVQGDPLQVGATQVARLSLDTSYEIPPFFSDGSDDVLGFEQFHGLRTVVSKTGFFAMGGSQDGGCLSIFSEADMLKARSGSFSGFAVGGCAAGRFPAIVQFMPDTEGSPEELRSVFPSPTALQWVYDQANNEVVVFAEAG